jgi:hypothetical protein
VGLGSPPSSVLCSAKTALYPSRVASLVARFPIPRLLPYVRGVPYGLVIGWKPPTRQGLWSPGPLIRECGRGDRWLSQVPELPLWMHAPFSDPGGVPHTRQNASGTVAFRCVQTVGFPLRTAMRDILLSTTIHISGLNHAACLLAHSSFVLPLLGWHVEFATDLLARLWSGGT